MIAIDSSVLIDLLGDDVGAASSEECLRHAMSRGPVVVCDVVLSEVVAGLGFGGEMMQTLEDVGIGFAPTEARSAARAGEMQRRYLDRMGASGKPPVSPRMVPDFLIGAHALLQCAGLITRDAGFFRDYFKGLKVIVPPSS